MPAFGAAHLRFDINTDMRKKLLFAAAVAAVFTLGAHARSVKGDFLNPKLPVEKRVDDLIGRMTVEEKVGQLLCPLGWEMYDVSADRKSVAVSQKFRELMAQAQPGMLWAVYRADPWTQRTLDNGLNPRLAAMAGNAIQKYVIENTRLGIPMFLAEEAPHGHMAIGATVFPTGIGMAATWNPELIESVGRVIGNEVRTQGAHISYGPVLDLVRDPRWSRVEETMGEDPKLAGTIGAAMVRGLGGGDLAKPNSTIATLKHFIAYAAPEGGQNGNFTTVGERDLYLYFLPPFHDAIDAGALSVMTSYNSVDGVPCTSNRELLTNLLRDRWKFRGYTVSDLYSIEGILGSHHTVPDMVGAATNALLAGLDVDLGGQAFRNLTTALKEGKITEADLDNAVRWVLTLKFEMGLFENPYVDPAAAARAVRNDSHRNVALDVARESVTLLKNSGSILPLDPKKVKVALVGPNADNVYNMLGDYTAPQDEGNVKTVRHGFLSHLSKENLVYVKGCAIRDTANTDIPAAVAAARGADVVVAVVGGSSARDFKTSYKETGAAVVDANAVSDMESGEGYDRATLTLMGRQQELLEALKATGKPLVVVYVEGRPLDKTWAEANADALLTAYYPGQEGGNAIADVIFGSYNPSGRLPYTVPRALGQIPIYYNRRSPSLHDYVELSAKPLYPFGYGLSYTTFEYSGLEVAADPTTGVPVSATLTVTNTGSRDGDEVVQLYARPKHASTVQPMKQLKAFSRVTVPAGKSVKVTLPLNAKDFEIIGLDMQSRLETAPWEIMVGASSDDIRLRATASITAPK